MTKEFVLEQADARGLYFVDVFPPSEPHGKPFVKVTDYVPLAKGFPSQREAELAASVVPGRWIARDESTIPPRVLK